MRRPTHLVRILGAACLAGSFALATTATAHASPPRWSMDVVKLPPQVHTGSDAAYAVSITNKGPSNISALYLVTGSGRTTDFVGQPTQGSCPGTATGGLACTFGALRAGQTVSVTVVYPTSAADGTSFDPAFQANTTGLTFSDGGTSHGDTLTFKAATALTTSGDFGGGYSLNNSKVSDDQSIGTGNQQSTSVIPPVTNIVATVEDGTGVLFPCKKACAKGFGEWSSVTVGDGQSFGTFFPVTVRVPRGLAPSNLSKVTMAHVDAKTGALEMLPQCGPSGPFANCVTLAITDSGTILEMTAWVDHNGGFKGMG
jgi:hypothetical protein